MSTDLFVQVNNLLLNETPALYITMLHVGNPKSINMADTLQNLLKPPKIQMLDIRYANANF